MTVGFKVGSIVDEVGSDTFLNSIFSTVSFHLEKNGWGTMYPLFMRDLYEGHLRCSHASEALKEIRDIKQKLKTLSPKQIVWDFEDLTKKPPWGDNISTDITDLSNYFVSSTGRDFFELIEECFQAMIDENEDLFIESY